jgi:Fe-S-cluster containining protein
MTAAEWTLLWQGLCQLAPARQAEVRQNIEALADIHCGPIICPLLDQTHGACLVYEYRPAICRMYGFYSSGMHNLWCDMLQKRYEAGAFDEVVLGNRAPVDRALQDQGGKTQTLLAWYRDTTDA